MENKLIKYWTVCYDLYRFNTELTVEQVLQLLDLIDNENKEELKSKLQTHNAEKLLPTMIHIKTFASEKEIAEMKFDIAIVKDVEVNYIEKAEKVMRYLKISF